MGKEDDEIDDIVYRGIEPESTEHTGYFGAGKKRGAHLTVDEDRKGDR